MLPWSMLAFIPKAFAALTVSMPRPIPVYFNACIYYDFARDRDADPTYTGLDGVLVRDSRFVVFCLLMFAIDPALDPTYSGLYCGLVCDRRICC